MKIHNNIDGSHRRVDSQGAGLRLGPESRRPRILDLSMGNGWTAASIINMCTHMYIYIYIYIYIERERDR